MPRLYSKEGMEQYRVADPTDKEKLPPHVYQTADCAYRAMLRGVKDEEFNNVRGNTPVKVMEHVQKDQSILVSGESGAGKTVTTKIVLNYFAVLSRRKSQEMEISKQNGNKKASIIPLNIHPPRSPVVVQCSYK